MVLEYILAATILVSLASFAGIITLALKEKRTQQVLFFFVSFSAGTLLGAAFLDLLPEGVEGAGFDSAMIAALSGILTFFILEKIIHWHHHHSTHKSKEEVLESLPKPLGYLSLFGDSLHNFFDGAAIAASFMVGIHTGIATTIAVLLHEIPQEIGDYSLLIYSGFERKKALMFNFISALLAVLGAVLFYFFAPFLENVTGLALAFTAGMFIYIANTDLVPELHKETEIAKSAQQLLYIMLGIATIWAIVTFLEV